MEQLWKLFRFAVSFFFFNDTATTEIYTLSLHDALPIYHTIVTQQGIDSRLAASKSRERFERRSAAADGEDLLAESRPSAGVEHAVLFEEAVCVGRKHLGPLVAVVTGCVSSRKNMREVVEEAVVLRRDRHRDFRPDFAEQLQRRLRPRGVVIMV